MPIYTGTETGSGTFNDLGITVNAGVSENATANLTILAALLIPRQEFGN
jgi:hypothetical protein